MTSFQVAVDPLESMMSPGRSPARNRRRLSKGGTEKENPDPKSPQSILKKGEQRRALGELHMFDVRSPARVEMVNGQSIEASPVFRKKKSKRSLSRRVSFAEKPAVRIFVKDTEYETPPDSKAQKAGLLSEARPAEPTAELSGAPPAQPPAEDFTFGMDGSADSNLLQFELLPAGNTGPVLWGQGAEVAAEGNTEPLTWGDMQGGTQQTTPPMQQQPLGGKHQATPQGTPGGNESSPEFFSPRNFVSPLSSDDGMELTHTPTADFELLPPQNEAFGSAFSNRRRSSLGGGPQPSFWGFEADLKSSPEGEQAVDPASFTDMTGSITAMVPKLAKILAEQQDFTFNTGLVGERNENVEETKMTAVSPVPSDMSLTPVNDELPTQQQKESPETKEAGFTFTASPQTTEEEHGIASGRKFGDLLAFEDDEGAGHELFGRDAAENRRTSITGAIPHLQDLLATDVEGCREEQTMQASMNRRGSITGAIPNLQALLEADQGRQEKSGEEAAAGQQEEAELPREDVFHFEVSERVGQIGSPDGGETTQLLNFEAFAKRMGAELLAAAKGDENVTASVPRLAHLVDVDGAEAQTISLRNENFTKAEQEVRAEEEEEAAPPAAGIAKTVLPLVFTGDDSEGVFGSRSRFGGSVRPSHGRASLQPSTSGGIRPLHRRGSVRGRASVGSGWAAMLNEEAQEQSAVNRWWVKDKPGTDQDLAEPQELAEDNKLEAEEESTGVTKSELVVTAGTQVALESTKIKTAPSVPEPSLLLLPSTTPSTKLPPTSLPEASLEAPSSKKRLREETEQDLEAHAEHSSASPQPATKKQRTMQMLTPVTEQMSALEREESQGTLFKIVDEIGTQEVTQFVDKEPCKDANENQADDEDRGAMQEEIPTQHSAVFGGLRNVAGMQDGAIFEAPSNVVGETKEPSELEYQMLRLEINGTAPAKSPSPNVLPVLSRLQLRRPAVKMQSALTTESSQEEVFEQSAAPSTAEIGLSKKHNEALQSSVTSRAIPFSTNEPLVDSQAELTDSAPTEEKQTEVAPPPSNGPLKTQPLATKDALPTDLSTALPEPPASQALPEGPAEPEADITETTLPLPPTRLQGLMHLRRESLGVLPPMQGVNHQKVSTPAAHRAFTPRGKENFTPLIGLSSVRNFRTPGADKAAHEAIRNDDTTAELNGEEENTGKVLGKISFAEFLYKAEVRFLDVRHRASMFAQQTPTAEVAPPLSLADFLKVVCFHQPQATILDFGCGELRETIAAKKASVAHFETKLQDTCPAIFQAVQTATGAERVALLKKLKDLKQRCRLEARRQWLEWRLKLEENASERLQENEHTLVEDLTAIQEKRQQLHDLRAQIESLHAQIQAETQQAQGHLRAAAEHEEETRNLQLRLMADMRQQQTEVERREEQAGQAQEYADRMAAKKQAAESKQQQVLERLHVVESECEVARAALVSSGAAGDDGLGNGRIMIDDSVMEKLKVKGDGKREELVKDLQAIASTQGWVITKVGWQAAQKEGSDQLPSQEGQVVAETADSKAEELREGVIELRHHSGLFTHTIFATGKDECPLESMLHIDEEAMAEAYPLVEGAVAFAAGVLGPVGQRIGNAKGRSTGSLVQEASLRIGRLFDLLEELADCRRDFAALSSITCTTAEGAGLLSLRFVNHSEGLMFTLAISVAQVTGSAYPFGNLPAQVTVQFAGVSSSQQVLETCVKAAVSSVTPGFHRFSRICRVLSQLS